MRKYYRTHIAKISTKDSNENVVVTLEGKSDAEIVKIAFVNDDAYITEQYQLLKDVTEMFDAANITYSMASGTVLGAMRHKGMIPWDDDVDLFVMSQEEVKFHKLVPYLKKLDYDLECRFGICKIFNKRNDKKGKWFAEPFIDIFLVHHNKVDGVIEYYYKNNIEGWPKEWIIENKFFPLKKYDFGPLKLYGPNNPDWYLSNFYGPTWKEDGHIIPYHSSSYDFQKIIKPIEGVYSQTLVPKNKLLDRTEGLTNEIRNYYNKYFPEN